jgi:hypothetical protein
MSIVGGKPSPKHTGIMKSEPDCVGGKLIAASEAERQVFAYVVPDLGTFVGIVAIGSQQPRSKCEFSQSGDERFV